MTYTVDKIKQQILNLIGDNVELDVPKNPEFGDFTTNIAMIKAKELKKNPREIAQNIISSMNFDNTLIERAEIAGAGFINFYLKPNWLANVLQDIFEAGDDYGRVNVGAGSKINLEYVSANPTGPMHMGNARGGALGDTLAKSLSFAGFDVTREFYLNDAGNQIEKFANSLLARYFQLSDESYPFPEDGYQGDDIKILAKEFADSNPQLMTSINNKDENSINDLKLQLINFGLAKNIAKIHEVLGNYGVEYDVWFKESQLHESNAVTECIDKLKSLDATYEKEGALWIKGDEKDEVLVRANGIPTYLAADIAYHYNKLVVRGFDKAINIWGADHYGHIARMKNAMKLLGVDPDRLHVITVQLVRLMRGNEIARMSKRKGDSVSLGDLIEEIGVDATRYFFNMRLANSHFDFDLDLAVKKNNDNPVYYVQYAHARICSVLEKAKDYINLDIDYNSAIFTDETEIALLKQLSLFPKNIEIISNTLEPSRLTHYASDLASLFHSFYGKCKVIDEDNLERTKYRISLCKATKIVLSKVLWLLGVSSPDKM